MRLGGIPGEDIYERIGQRGAKPREKDEERMDGVETREMKPKWGRFYRTGKSRGGKRAKKSRYIYLHERHFVLRK